MTKKLTLHPLCELFPKMNDKDYAALRDDIRDHGLRQPIITLDGEILDGRNRYDACVETGTRFEIKEFDGTDPLGFVLSLNLHRRHLSSGQQAAIVSAAQDWSKAKKAGKPVKVPNGTFTETSLDTVEDRAKVSGASRRTQLRADKVAKASPELIKQVAQGGVPLSQAVEQVDPKPTKLKKSQEPKEEPYNAFADFDPIAELEEMQKTVASLQAKIVSLTADDAGKELAKQVDLANAMQARLNQEMGKLFTMEQELKRQGNLLTAIRKQLGVDDDRKIVTAIKALNTKAAA